jgi:hypothetical protein
MGSACHADKLFAGHKSAVRRRDDEGFTSEMIAFVAAAIKWY